jgi:hypothetical protein
VLKGAPTQRNLTVWDRNVQVMSNYCSRGIQDSVKNRGPITCKQELDDEEITKI